jgi:hypothetical protein
MEDNRIPPHDSNKELGVAARKRADAQDAASDSATPDVETLHAKQNPTAAQRRAQAKRDQADGDDAAAKRTPPAKRTASPPKSTTGDDGK